MAYKYALQAAVQKQSYLTQSPLPAKYAEVSDMQRMAPVTSMEQPTEAFNIDSCKLEEMATALSALFGSYPNLQNTSVSISGQEENIYRYTSEQVKLKHPQSNVRVKVEATVEVNSDHSKLQDVMNVIAATPDRLPSLDVLKQKVTKMADNLTALLNAPVMDEYYSGPVMFEEGAAASVLMGHLYERGFLLAQKTLNPPANKLEEKMGRKVIDERITVKNYTGLKEYNGTPVMESYEVDADGVTPKKEMTLIEKGVFKRQLNGRYPTLKAPQSTGSARFAEQQSKDIFMQPAFGTLHIQVEGGTAQEKMKKELLKLAKKAKLEYAYIVWCPQECSSLMLYRINVENGEETLVRTQSLTLPTLKKLEKMAAISKQENVIDLPDLGYNTSLIYPASFILPKFEIEKSTPRTAKPDALVYPLQRK